MSSVVEEVEAVELRRIQLRRDIAAGMKEIRAAVDAICSASDPMSNEIREALAELPEEERSEFVQLAGWAVMELGGYIGWAVRKT